MATKIALLTGANKGIGFETARQLGAQGVTVLVGARDEDRGRAAEHALRDGGADARFVQLDVTDAKSVQRAAEWIDAEYGRLDILVNNAGTASVARRGAAPSQTRRTRGSEAASASTAGRATSYSAMRDATP